MADIFISYQKRDRDLVILIADALARDGLSVWWDDALTPQEHWDLAIETEIDQCRFMLVLWTRNSLASRWVREEANKAADCQPSKLIQLRFDNARVPFGFTMGQYLDLDRAAPDASPAWQKLRYWLGKAPAPVAIPSRPPPQIHRVTPIPPAPAAPPNFQQRGAIQGVVVTLIATALFGTLFYQLAPPPRGHSLMNAAAALEFLWAAPVQLMLLAFVAPFAGVFAGAWVACRTAGTVSAAWPGAGIVTFAICIPVLNFALPWWFDLAFLATPAAAVMLVSRLLFSPTRRSG